MKMNIFWNTSLVKMLLLGGVVFMATVVLATGCENVDDTTEQTETSAVESSSTRTGESSAGYTGERYLDRILKLSLEKRREVLENGHRKFLNLPVEPEYVSGVILPELRENRKSVVPQFPERGGTPEETNDRFNTWLEDHPEQLAIYLEFLDDQYQQYERSLP